MPTLADRLSKLFRKGRPVEVDATPAGGPPAGRKLSKSQQRELAIRKLQEGYGEVAETMQALRQHMAEQSRRSDQAMQIMSQLPQLLRSIPENQAAQTRMLEAMQSQMTDQAQSSARLSTALTDLASATSSQQTALSDLHRQMEASRASGEALRDSLGILAESMSSVTDASHANVHAVNNIAEQTRRNQDRTESLFTRSQKHATAMSAVSWALALVALAVAGYVAVSAVNQPTPIAPSAVADTPAPPVEVVPPDAAPPEPTAPPADAPAGAPAENVDGGPDSSQDDESLAAMADSLMQSIGTERLLGFELHTWRD